MTRNITNLAVRRGDSSQRAWPLHVDRRGRIAADSLENDFEVTSLGWAALKMRTRDARS